MFRSFCNKCKQLRLLVDTKASAGFKWLPRNGDWICSGKYLFTFSLCIFIFLHIISSRVFHSIFNFDYFNLSNTFWIVGFIDFALLVEGLGLEVIVKSLVFFEQAVKS